MLATTLAFQQLDLFMDTQIYPGDGIFPLPRLNLSSPPCWRSIKGFAFVLYTTHLAARVCRTAHQKKNNNDVQRQGPGNVKPAALGAVWFDQTGLVAIACFSFSINSKAAKWALFDVAVVWGVLNPFSCSLVQAFRKSVSEEEEEENDAQRRRRRSFVVHFRQLGLSFADTLFIKEPLLIM